MMQAIVAPRYGSPDVLRLQEVAKPTPQANQVLIKIQATSVNAADWHLLRADPFLVRFENGLFTPKRQILGADIAGRVEAVGEAVTQFKPGDEVFGDISGAGWGGFAEYVAAPENVLVKKPARLSFEEAAAIPMAAVTALKSLRDKGQLKAGQKVLINGASGGVGTFAVQLAKVLGAEVTAVCSTAKVEMVRSLGADHVIDYSREDFTRNGQQYDLILAANGNRSLFEYRRVLKPAGIYMTSGGGMFQLFQAIIVGSLLSLVSRQTFGNVLSLPDQKALAFITDLIEQGKVTPVIDRCYPFAETAEAIRYVEAGHAKGKVIVTF